MMSHYYIKQKDEWAPLCILAEKRWASERHLTDDSSIVLS